MDEQRRLAIQTIADMDQLATYLESEDPAERRAVLDAMRNMILRNIDNDEFVEGLINCIRQSAEKTAQGEHDEPEDST